jgi:Ca-activated chloride channel family protein
VTRNFLAPERFWLLIGVAVLAALYVWSLFRRRRNAVRFTNVELLDSIAPKRPGWRRHVVAAGTLLGLGVGVVASAQPYRLERVSNERSIIMLTIDVSLSMMAEDVAPSRLAAAKSAAKEFVEQVDPSIDIGLVAFSLQVRTRVQPTLDRDRILNAIDDLRLDQGTNIGGAIEGSVDVITSTLKDQPLGDGNRDGSDDSEDGGTGTDPTPNEFPGAVVVLSDGETTLDVPGGGVKTGPEGAVLAQENGIPVYGIAFGTPDGVVRLDDPRTGEQVEQPVPVKYEELTEAAAMTGGQFYKAETANSLVNAYADIEQKLSPALEVPEPEQVDLTWKYVLVALSFLALAFALGLWWIGGLV